MPVTSDAPLCEIKITLRDTEPEPWRRIRVRADIPLDRLHMIIQHAMGWTNSHLHEFEVRNRRFGMMLDDDFAMDPPEDERKVRLWDVAGPRMRFVYRYDFGDGWEHEIKVEKLIEPGSGLSTPMCLAGEFACPPEDCGGPWAYNDMLATLAGPPSEERTHFLEWLGADFDPTAFNLNAVNKRLARIKS
jgi:hypothetical protein